MYDPIEYLRKNGFQNTTTPVSGPTPGIHIPVSLSKEQLVQLVGHFSDREPVESTGMKTPDI